MVYYIIIIIIGKKSAGARVFAAVTEARLDSERSLFYKYLHRR